MSIPNLESVVRQVRERYPEEFPTKAMLCTYGREVIAALHAADPNFGELKKNPGQNQCADSQGRPCAVDAALYRTNGQVVDFILSAGFGTGPRPPDLDPDEEWPPKNRVAWGPGHEGEYDPAEKWFAPVAWGGPVDPVDPVEPGTTGNTEPFTPPMSLPRLAADVAGLQANFIEVLKQLTLINNQAAELDQRIARLEASLARLEARRYRGSLRTPFGQVPVTITVEE